MKPSVVSALCLGLLSATAAKAADNRTTGAQAFSMSRVQQSIGHYGQSIGSDVRGMNPLGFAGGNVGYKNSGTGNVGAFNSGTGNVGAFNGNANTSSTSGNHNVGAFNGNGNTGEYDGTGNVGAFNGNFNGGSFNGNGNVGDGRGATISLRPARQPSGRGEAVNGKRPRARHAVRRQRRRCRLDSGQDRRLSLWPRPYRICRWPGQQRYLER
ncbi:MAG: hypothetical protein E5W25_29575 [Mesorhizobium sp.]|nr:MAG: hypothetical protein E5W25_29575 [Mesorhizobium sp.]